MRISLRAARINAGLTAKQAAEKIGISEWSIYGYEHYKHVPKWSVIDKMVEVYGVPVDNLILSKPLTESEDA